MKSIRQQFSTTPFIQVQDLVPAETASKGAVSHQLHRQTYVCLRSVMATAAILTPIVFLVSAIWVGMQGSLSAFYHTDARNVFVGLVFAIGICLYVYKGYNSLENICLTAAGVFLFGVALAPTAPPPGSSNWALPAVHYICAITFFGLIAVVCIFARSHGLHPSGYDLKFRAWYNVTAGLMGTIILVAALLFVLKRAWGIEWRTAVFWVEAAAVWVFAGYWCLKSRELSGLE